MLQDAPHKLTAVTASHGTRKVQTFLMLPYVDGKAVLTGDFLTTIQDKLKVRLGDGYTIG